MQSHSTGAFVRVLLHLNKMGSSPQTVLFNWKGHGYSDSFADVCKVAKAKGMEPLDAARFLHPFTDALIPLVDVDYKEKLKEFMESRSVPWRYDA